jgi:hypothetical protein
VYRSLASFPHSCALAQISGLVEQLDRGRTEPAVEPRDGPGGGRDDAFRDRLHGPGARHLHEAVADGPALRGAIRGAELEGDLSVTPAPRSRVRRTDAASVAGCRGPPGSGRLRRGPENGRRPGPAGLAVSAQLADSRAKHKAGTQPYGRRGMEAFGGGGRGVSDVADNMLSGAWPARVFDQRVKDRCCKN